jgi:hypothetical protein
MDTVRTMVLSMVALCAAATTTSAAEADAVVVRQARTTLNKLLADHDMDGLRAFIAEKATDDVFLSTPAWRSAGREQVFETLKERTVGARPILVWDHVPEDIFVNEAQNFIAERGTYTQRWNGKGVINQWQGTYFAIWKRFAPGGPWLLDVESFVPLKCTGDDECAPRPAQRAAPVRLPASPAK